MKKKMLALIIATFLVMLPVVVSAEEAVAKIGEKTYQTLTAAIEEVAAGETITLLKDISTPGIKVASGKNFTIDFAGYTVSFDKPEVGSAGTETNTMQLLKNSTIVFKNGTIEASPDAKRFIQNYSNLTLKDMTIDATTSSFEEIYAVSNNNGTISIEGETNIYSQYVAVDAYGYYGGGYPNGPQVTINTTGTIEGDIEVDCDAGTPTTELKLVIKNVNHVGNLVIKKEELKDNVTIENGTYTDGTVTEVITPAEGNEVYEIITQDGEYKVVVEDETKVEEGYFGLGFSEEGFEEVFGSQEDYEEVMGLIKEKLAEKYTAAIYYEIVFGNLINNNFVLGTEIEELESAIKVTLDIPTDLEKVADGYTRNYVIIRIHDGKAEELKTTDNGDGTVSFETDKFSTYVLAYEDVKDTTNPKTFDSASLYIILGGLSLVGLATVSVLLKKRNA